MKKILLALAFLALAGPVHAADKKIVLIAGRASHGPGAHEHRAGCLLLQSALNGVPGVSAVVCATEGTAAAAAVAAMSLQKSRRCMRSSPLSQAFCLRRNG